MGSPLANLYHHCTLYRSLSPYVTAVPPTNHLNSKLLVPLQLYPYTLIHLPTITHTITQHHTPPTHHQPTSYPTLHTPTITTETITIAPSTHHPTLHTLTYPPSQLHPPAITTTPSTNPPSQLYIYHHQTTTIPFPHHVPLLHHTIPTIYNSPHLPTRSTLNTHYTHTSTTYAKLVWDINIYDLHEQTPPCTLHPPSITVPSTYPPSPHFPPTLHTSVPFDHQLYPPSTTVHI